MTERKSSTSPTANSKGGAGELAKQVQRKFSRAQEKVLQKFGKSEETKDTGFEVLVQNLQDQQSDGHRIYKDLKAYLNAVRVMRDASSHLFQSLFDAYEHPNWEGGEDLGAVVEGEDLLWNDYEAKLRDQALLTMESYMSQFPDMREKVGKRGRKLVDYDFARHQLESLQKAKKRDDIKIEKAEEEVKMAKSIFEDMNRELKDELPHVYDSRIGCYVTVFQAISNLREIFYKEMAENNKNLQDIMMNLKAQYPDKNFVVRNFTRGTLKRRSIKDALSPRSLRASFSELHMSYGSRGTLRREQSSSFRFDKGLDHTYRPQVLTSPTRPKPPKNTNNQVRETDTGSTTEDNPEVDSTPPTTLASEIDHAKASQSAKSITNDVKQENEGSETKERLPLGATEQDGEMMSLDLKGDSSSGSDNDKLDYNSERANMPLSDHNTQPEELDEPGVGMDSKIATNCKPTIEAPGVSCKENTINDQISDEMKDDTY